MTTNMALIIVAILTLALTITVIWFAVIDYRADREHLKWMRRNDIRRRRTEVEVAGIRYGYRGMGLDGRADHQRATRKNTRP